MEDEEELSDGGEVPPFEQRGGVVVDIVTALLVGKKVVLSS